MFDKNIIVRGRTIGRPQAEARRRTHNHGDVNTPNEAWSRDEEYAADGISDDPAGVLRKGGGGNSPTAPVASATRAANGGTASGTHSTSGTARSSCRNDAIARDDIADARAGSGELQWPGSQSKRAADS